uniref:Uncharacterized protein n=1 Tax=Sinocyclocheilus anshuiensis TaxID=1608454 RepID=A0A671R3H4_9TELE
MEIAVRFSALARLDLPFVKYSWEFCRLAVATALDDATINFLFWLGGHYHCPVDLPDTPTEGSRYPLSPGRAPDSQFSPGRAPDSPFSPERAPDPQSSPGRARDPQSSPGRAPDPQSSPARAPDPQSSPGRAPVPHCVPLVSVYL